MFGYVLTLCLMLLVYYAFHNKTRYSQKNFLIWTTVIMIFFYGLRASNVGSDTISYINMFVEDGNQRLGNLWAYMWEEKSPAFVLFEWIFYRILPFPQLWLIATSAFFFIAFGMFIYENSETPVYSYFMFFTIFGTFQMTGVRQSCAMAVFLMAYRYIKEKKIVKYLLMIGLAYLFHKSAVVLLPIYWFKNRKIRKIDVVVIIIIMSVIYQNRLELFDYIKGFTSYNYFEALQHKEPINFSFMIYATTLLSFILYCILDAKVRRVRPINNTEYRIQRIERDLPYYSLYTNSMYFASFFMPLVAVNGSVRRIVMYYALFMIIVVPKGISALFPEQRVQVIIKGALGALLVDLLLSGVTGSSYAYSLCF